MMTFIDDFTTINQHRPWLMPFLNIHQAFGRTYAGGNLCDWLNDYFDKHHITPKKHQDNTPLSFTAQNDLPHGTSYEQFIYQTGKIPTRNNLHDWFGACVWSVFPKSKAVLNAKHLAHLQDNLTANGRNRVRDTITVFDENGAILVVSDDKIGKGIGEALKDFKWQKCLVESREHWSNDQNDNSKNAKVFIFGHALLEQLITPYKGLCSHTLVLTMPPVFFEKDLATQLAMLDDSLADYLMQFLQSGVTPRALNPLPILGVPYFWQGQDEAFYNDVNVFRTGRRKVQSKTSHDV